MSNYPDDVTGNTPGAPWNLTGEVDEAREEYLEKVEKAMDAVADLESLLVWLDYNHPGGPHVVQENGDSFFHIYDQQGFVKATMRRILAAWQADLADLRAGLEENDESP